MPVFEFTSPEGKTYEVTAPEGATKAQAWQVLQGQLSQLPVKEPQNEINIFNAIPQALGNVFADVVLRPKDVAKQLGLATAERGLGIMQLGTDAAEYLGADVSDLQRRQRILAEEYNRLQNESKLSGLTNFTTSIAGDPAAYAATGVKMAGGAFLPRVAKNAAIGAGLGGAEGAIAAVTDEGQRAANIKFGATLGGVIPAAIDTATTLSPIRAGAKMVKKAVMPISESAAQSRVADRLQEVTPNINELVQSAPETQFINPTLEQIIPESGIAGLTDKARGKSAQFRQEEQLRNIQNIKALEEAKNISLGAGDIGQTQQFANDLINRVSQRTVKAKDAAIEALQPLRPTMTEGGAGALAKDKIEASRQAFIQTRRNPAWQAVPRDIPITANNTLSKLKELQDKVGVAKQEFIPAATIKKVTDLGKAKIINTGLFDESGNAITRTQPSNNLTIGEMQDLRSQLLEDAAIAKAANQGAKATFHEQLADAVLNDMGAKTGNIKGEAGAALRNALDTEREYKTLFYQGKMGDVTGVNRDRSASIVDKLTLDKLLGAGRTKGDVGLDQLLKAAPEAKAEASQYMLNNFSKMAINPQNGALNEAQALRFMRDNKDILQKFPDIEKNINNAISASKRYSLAEDKQKAIFDALQIKESGGLIGANRTKLASDFLQGDAAQAIDVLMKSKRPDAIRDIVATAKKDLTGGAMIGMRSGMADYIFKNGGNGEGIIKMLQDPKSSQIIRQVLPPAHVNRIAKIAQEMSMMERKVAAANIDGKLIEPDNLVQALAGYLGAQTAGKLTKGMGAGSLKYSSRVINAFEKIAGKITTPKAEALLIEALLDPSLTKTITMKLNNKEGEAVLERNLTKWLSGNTGKIWRENMEDEQQPLPTPNNPQNAPIPSEPLTLDITPQSNTFTMQNEGLRTSVYNDTTGNPTIGYGFNFNSGIAPKAWKQSGLARYKNMQKVKRGEESITPQEAQVLHQTSMSIAAKDAMAYYPDYERLSQPQQEALLDMSYQMGINSLNEFKGLKNALKKQDKNAIVKSIINSNYYQQTPERAKRVAAMLTTLQGERNEPRTD